MANPVRMTSLSNLHQMLGIDPPKHPLISIINIIDWKMPDELVGVECTSDFYLVMLKEGACDMRYGRNSYDFEEGFLSFIGPDQIVTTTEQHTANEGWMLLFHPDLLINSSLNKSIHDYKFFSYAVHEALHLSDKEKGILADSIDKINFELEQNIDAHSNKLLVSNIELLMNYCSRFYERQFHSRNVLNIDLIDKIEHEIRQYYTLNEQLEHGMLSVKQLAERTGYSPNYLGDLLKKETGKNAKQHVQSHVVEIAKNLLASSDRNVSEIAYDLGFNYPHYFSRLFKSSTGVTPQAFRSTQLN